MSGGWWSGVASTVKKKAVDVAAVARVASQDLQAGIADLAVKTQSTYEAVAAGVREAATAALAGQPVGRTPVPQRAVPQALLRAADPAADLDVLVTLFPVPPVSSWDPQAQETT